MNLISAILNKKGFQEKHFASFQFWSYFPQNAQAKADGILQMVAKREVCLLETLHQFWIMPWDVKAGKGNLICDIFG